ncbi:hypothetical protein [Frankia sp. CiP3]|uniref:hypothetical protein n=1 Tax=Frankia sp. CiP3 TaxID=2880971 RepID=UPI001EF55A4B|nr:hypothetical protein [Frankia sp. CiP3]
MENPQPSGWAEARFGALAGELCRAIPEAIHRAHELALAAHVSAELATNDAYGATLHAQQHQQLAEQTRGLDGVRLRKPLGVRSRFELVVVDAMAVVLYPWRYATDRATPRTQAKFRTVSDLRKNLLTLTARTVDPQLTIDHIDLDPEDLDADFADEQAVLDQLAAFGQVVTVGYASSPSLGVFDLGWGELELVDDETGEVIWHGWEPLRRRGHGGAGGAVASGPLKPVDGSGRTGRFDDAPLEDKFNMAPRSPLAAPPTSEPEPPQRPTGSDETD